MNLHQLRFVREAVRQNLNLTAAARALYTSQPGISKSIIELEHELGIEIFVRHGRRIHAVTEQGWLVVAAAERILREVEALRRVGPDYATQDRGQVVIATTRTFSRYRLAHAIARFRARFPHMAVSVVHGCAEQVAQMARSGEADLALTTVEVPQDDGVVTMPGPALRPVAIVPLDHPLASHAQVDLAGLTGAALVVDDETFGRDDLFRTGPMSVDVAVHACDAEMVKRCVELGLGIGIMADAALDPRHDNGVRALPIATDTAPPGAWIALRRTARARRALQALAELLAAEPSTTPGSRDPLAHRIEPAPRPGGAAAMRCSTPAVAPSDRNALQIS